MMLIDRRTLLQYGSAAFAGLVAAGCDPGEAMALSDGEAFDAACANLGEVMSAHIRSGYVPGLTWAVEHRDNMQVAAAGLQSYGGALMTDDSIFRIASIGKPIAAAAAMVLVDDGRITLDEPVDRFLPELANRRVLRSLGSTLDDTVPAARPITLRDLLSFRFGLGAIMTAPGRFPIQNAMAERGVAPGEAIFAGSPDEFMRRLGELPLAFQPGEAWLYHTGSEVAGVLVARAAGKSLGSFMKERIFDPLGMKDTGFFVPTDKVDRLVTAYMGTPAANGGAVFDKAADGVFARSPAFESGGGGLVSTAGDCLTFYRMLAGGGALGDVRVLSAQSAAEMTTDQITRRNKRTPDAKALLAGGSGWGLGVEVQGDGSFGWIGSYGTVAICDPKQSFTGILMTQRLMDLDSPDLPPTMIDFWTACSAFAE